VIENQTETRSIYPDVDHHCNASRAAIIAVLDALAAIVRKDPAILEVIEQAIEEDEARDTYRAWLDQYRFIHFIHGETTLDKDRLGHVFSGLGQLTKNLSWADIGQKTNTEAGIACGDHWARSKTRTIIDHILLSGPAWVVDDGHSLAKLCKLADGVAINSAPLIDCIGLNPFSNIINIDEQIGELTRFFGVMVFRGKSVGDSDLASIRYAIRTAYEVNRAKTTPTEVQRALQAAPDDRSHRLAAMMHPFVITGEYGEICNRPMALDCSGHLVHVNACLDAFPKVLQPLVVLQILSEIANQNFYANQRSERPKASSEKPLLFISGTVYSLLANANAIAFVNEIGGRMRKYHGLLLADTSCEDPCL
jgi:hypothetical protein